MSELNLFKNKLHNMSDHMAMIILFHSYSTFHMMSQCTLHYFPWSLGQYHSYNHSQLLVEYTAHYYVQTF